MTGKYMNYVSKCAEDTERAGESLARKLAAGGAKKAFIAMRGEMGVGKTAFVRGFARALGIGGVKSPTYAIVNEYANERARIIHFDMYRIGSEDDLLSVAYDDYLAKDAYILAEWSERIEEFIPSDAIGVTIARTGGDADERTIEIEGIEIDDNSGI